MMKLFFASICTLFLAVAVGTPGGGSPSIPEAAAAAEEACDWGECFMSCQDTCLEDGRPAGFCMTKCERICDRVCPQE